MRNKVTTALLAALTTLSFAVPVQAAPEEVSPAMSFAMQRDLGLTKAQVSLRLAQEAEAARVEKKARALLGQDFGGAWFSAELGRLIVHTPGPVMALAGAEVRPVQRSERELLALKSRIDRLKAPSGVVSVHVNVHGNNVVVQVAEEVPDFVAASRELSPDIVVAKVAARPRPFAEVLGGLPYYIQNAWRCSIGFPVHGGFVTAGHCGQPGHRTTNDGGEELGFVERSIFPDRDMGFVRTHSNVTLQPLVYGYDGYAYYVLGSDEAPIGASVCRSGSTTGMHCGEIRTKHETIHYAEGAVHDMTGTSVCAEGGDSGGSWLSGNQAQGVTSGGYGDCTSGGATWFQPLNPILSEFGLTLLTA